VVASGFRRRNQVYMNFPPSPILVFKLNMWNKNHPGGPFKLEFSLSTEMMEASLS